jgi:hypothetical protein
MPHSSNMTVIRCIAPAKVLAGSTKVFGKYATPRQIVDYKVDF